MLRIEALLPPHLLPFQLHISSTVQHHWVPHQASMHEVQFFRQSHALLSTSNLSYLAPSGDCSTATVLQHCVASVLQAASYQVCEDLRKNMESKCRPRVLMHAKP